MVWNFLFAWHKCTAIDLWFKSGFNSNNCCIHTYKHFHFYVVSYGQKSWTNWHLCVYKNRRKQWVSKFWTTAKNNQLVWLNHQKVTNFCAFESSWKIQSHIILNVCTNIFMWKWFNFKGPEHTHYKTFKISHGHCEIVENAK